MEPKLKCGEYSPAITLPQPAVVMNELPEELTNAILFPNRSVYRPITLRMQIVAPNSLGFFRNLADATILLRRRKCRRLQSSNHAKLQISLHFALSRHTGAPSSLPHPAPSCRQDDDEAVLGSEYRYLQVAGCCNGLICVSDKEDGRPENLILWNPATAETKVLPPPFSSGFSLVLGFGFDSEKNDYKILRQAASHLLEVYSLRNDSWRKFYDRDYPYLPYERIPQLHKGKLYWSHFSGRDRILVFDSFDISTEKLERVEVRYPLPEDIDHIGSMYMYEFSLNEESMVVLCSSLDYYSKGITSSEIWVLLKYWASESWTKLLVLDVKPPLEIETFKGNVACPLGNIIRFTGLSRNLKCFFRSMAYG